MARQPERKAASAEGTPASAKGNASAEADAGVVRLDARVRGTVQGVGFRWFVVRVAAGLDLAGWVANDADGTVHCVAEGRREALERLLEQLRAGPPGARVADVSATWLPAAGGLDGFAVRSSWHGGD
jgi:acylphosphatase